MRVLISLILALSLSQAVIAGGDLFQQYGITRVDSSEQLARAQLSNRSFTYNTQLRVPKGDAYVIVTDLKDPAYLSALNALAKFHSGKILQLDNSRDLIAQDKAQKDFIESLKKLDPQYVVFAPRLDNYSENVMLAFWQSLAKLGGGELNVYPSIFVAPDLPSFKSLVDHSIKLSPINKQALAPVLICQSTTESAGGLRAVEKTAFLEDMFDAQGIKNGGIVVKTASAPNEQYSQVGSLGVLNAPDEGMIPELPANLKNAICQSNLLVLFGHGMPGMTCSLSVAGMKDIKLDKNIVLCGSCFSAVPYTSDVLPNPRRREPFFGRAIENGASIFYGHMNTNGGFPELYVVLDALLNGESAGQAYQRLLNQMIKEEKLPIDRYVMTDNDKNIAPRNKLLEILIGDAAAVPFAGEGRSVRK